ncbi:hypothetical protein GHT06_019227 [Daphnia sinensis]|uniref:Uncharacterized protein n=1 Tax=Daphnia sinensis TaxID=1820382 RepID=A0AAD5KJR0_9CRUS|nr:hypothetical protein GHT06_019227 [Daphnia sinensis]
MKCLMILAVLVAAVAAAPQFLPYPGYSSFGYTGLPYAAAPAFSYGYNTAPLAYAAPVPVASAVAAPVAYAAPAPVAYQTGAKVVAKYEPVEQHGYQIAY